MNKKQMQVEAIQLVKSLAEPLSTSLGIDGFCYHKILAPGKELMLSNTSHWFEEVQQSKLAAGADYFQQIAQKETKFDLFCWPMDSDMEVVHKARQLCNWNYGVTLSSNHNEFFGFSISGETDIRVLNTLVNLKGELEKFCLYFREHTDLLINSSKDIATIDFEPTNTTMGSNTSSFTEDKINHFEKSILPRHFYFQALNKHVNITPKELLCLRYLIRGSSLQSIAHQLHVSRRTVETHINNIKIKLGLYSKQALLDLIYNTPNTLRAFLKSF